MRTYRGIGTSDGIAIGAFHTDAGRVRVTKRSVVADTRAEQSRFEKARQQAVSELKALHKEHRADLGEYAEIFYIHALMLEDTDYRDSVRCQIAKGTNAEYAVQQACTEFSGLFSRMNDAYFKERAADVVDISHRVLDILTGTKKTAYTGFGKMIYGAVDFLPSQTIRMVKSGIAAFVIEKGSELSHAAIMARVLGLPSVVRLGGVLSDIKQGMPVIVDGFLGVVIVEPTADVLAEYCEKLDRHEAGADRRQLCISWV